MVNAEERYASSSIFPINFHSTLQSTSINTLQINLLTDQDGVNQSEQFAQYYRRYIQKILYIISYYDNIKIILYQPNLGEEVAKESLAPGGRI